MHAEAGGQRPEQVVQLVGTGGTASILGCMEAELPSFDRQRLEATRLSLERLHAVFGLHPMHWQEALAPELDRLAQEMEAHETNGGRRA